MYNPRTQGKFTTASAMMTVASQDVRRDYQAYQILHWAFVLTPFIAGLDKFTRVLFDWFQYLSQPFNFFGVATTMHVVGVVEMIVGIGMALKPRFFAPILTVWLWAIMVNLLCLGNHYDIALRDFGLSLGALGLWRLSQHFDTSAKEVEIRRTEGSDRMAP